MSVTMTARPEIERVVDPLVPQFVFEWHRSTGKVYILETPGEHVGGEFVPAESGVRRAVCIAEHPPAGLTHAGFYGIAQTWLRGYKKAVADFGLGKIKESAVVRRAEELRESGLLKGQTG